MKVIRVLNSLAFLKRQNDTSPFLRNDVGIKEKPHPYRGKLEIMNQVPSFSVWVLEEP